MLRGNVFDVGNVGCLRVRRTDVSLSTRAADEVRMNLYNHLNSRIKAVNVRRQMVIGIEGEANAIECD